ncbi:SLATT domain-containing protein [Rathayibacter sp. AY1F4]|uniref:SLATT domain-containing protein n=1 Tax=Rathayibacter sp. AY1F4 TaxID=2080559 RepID=UPI0011AFD3DF|nr:SLATT domain-containing protein [Rathayibacter sp. AY1F4]
MGDDDGLMRQAWGLALQCRTAAEAQSMLARRWSLVNFWVGLPAAILAAAAGAASFAELAGPVVAGVLATAAAVLSASLLFLQPATLSARAAVAANKYRATTDSATQLVNEAGSLARSEASSWLASLVAEKQRTNEAADLPPRGLWKRAVKEALETSDGVYYSWTNHLMPEDLQALHDRSRARRRRV